MCISKPQKVIEYNGGYAVVEFMGERKRLRSPFPLRSGDYILSQSGLVVRRITKSEADKMLKEWEELNDF